MASQTLSGLGYTKPGDQWSPDLFVGPIASASAKYGIPASILTGVFGQETTFGADLKTSSAGAQGPFQFLPSTASQYAYPLTNDPTAAQFQQQADAAANYLSVLFKQYGNWNTALEHYSGGGYGLAQVTKQAGTASTSPQFGATAGGFPSAGAVAATDTAVSGAVSAVSALSFFTSPSFWLRIGEAILGVVVLVLGLHALTGQSSSAGEQATKVKHVFVPV